MNDLEEEISVSKYNSILDTIGNTPLVRLNRMAPKGINVYVKVESFNPMGSVKDRMALAMIEAAEASGELQPGQTVIEATSGNTGIGLAMVCAQKGYPLVVTMAENFSIERRKMLRFLGAKVVLTPAAEKGSGMLAKAEELAEAHGYFLCRQFENEANANVHTCTTAREILEDFPDAHVDYFVSGFGTGGTLTGIARALRQHSPSTVVIATEPDNAPVLASGIAQPRDSEGKPSASHPSFRPHLMQGWSPDFVSRLTESAVTEKLIDQIVAINGDDAMRTARELATQEGIFVGTSSGATLAGALQIASRAPAGSNIVCMLPDTGERYLSTPLFADIEAEMNADEKALSVSTPRFRFDQSASAAVAPIAAELDLAAVSFFEETLEEEPVVMFALEWCEFCWSVRKLFDAMGVRYKSVDLDSVQFQANDLGGKIRAVMNKRLNVTTIPQIFIGGEHIGGCTELFDAYNAGDMQALLTRSGVLFDETATVNPYTLLPSWLHTRGAA